MHQVQTISREDFGCNPKNPQRLHARPLEQQKPICLELCMMELTVSAGKPIGSRRLKIDWLLFLQKCLKNLGHKLWIYKEGRNRAVYVLETSAKFLSIDFDPRRLTTKARRIAYIRGFFDAEGGLPKNPRARFYIQLVQKIDLN